jgi:hypothetical protein
MVYGIKKSKAKGRPKSDFKVRSIRGITPKGFDSKDYEIKNGEIVFRRKK